MKPELLQGEPPELVVFDEQQACPYFPERRARLPLRMPLRTLRPHEAEQRLAAGDRRWGRFLYRPRCPACRDCEPIRVEVERFRPRRSQRRALRLGDRELSIEIGEPRVDDERLALYERHRGERGLAVSDRATSAEDYFAFLVDRCVDAQEFRYSHGGRLVGVAVADRAASSLSAVYCFYDPRLRRLGVGTYSILRQIDYCREQGLRYLYLGLFVAGHPHMAYKAQFTPHERLIDGSWRAYDRVSGGSGR